MKNLSHFLYIFLFLTVGCSIVRNSALTITGDLIHQGSDEVFTEANLNFFQKAIPGNLKLLEGLWFGDQKNEVLLLMLIKGHVGHTFASLETEAYKDVLLDKNSLLKEQTILGYQKALFYGEKFLELRGISKADFYQKDFPIILEVQFDSKLSKDDYAAIFYFAQALGSSINLQRDNIAKMSNLNHVKAMLNWVCRKNPELENGNCALFQGIFEASTPTVLGGRADLAKKIFENLIKKYPENLLIRLSYIQYHLIPLLEEDEYTIEMQQLGKELSSWYQLQLGNVGVSNKHFESKRQFNLYNAVAKERYKILKNTEKEIF